MHARVRVFRGEAMSEDMASCMAGVSANACCYSQRNEWLAHRCVRGHFVRLPPAMTPMRTPTRVPVRHCASVVNRGFNHASFPTEST